MTEAVAQIHDSQGRPVSAGSSPPLIYARMLDIQRRVGIVPKAEQASEAAGGFWYRGIDTVLAAVHPHLAEVGVFVTSELLELTPWEYDTTKGKRQQAVTVRVRHRFYAEDGSFVELVTAGTASDSGDRATTQAQTAAYRDALVQVFSIPVQGPVSDHACKPTAQERQQQGPRGGQQKKGGPPLVTPGDVKEIRDAALARAQELGAAPGPEAEAVRDAMLGALCEKVSIPNVTQLKVIAKKWALEGIAKWAGEVTS